MNAGMEGRMTGYRSRLSYHPHPRNATIISDSSQYSEQCILEDPHSGNNTRLGKWQLAPPLSDKFIEFHTLEIINRDVHQIQSFPLAVKYAAVHSWFDIGNESNRPFYSWNQLHHTDLRPVTSYSLDFIEYWTGNSTVNSFEHTNSVIKSCNGISENLPSTCENTNSDSLVIILCLAIVSSLLFASLIYIARKRLRSCAGETVAQSFTSTLCSN